MQTPTRRADAAAAAAAAAFGFEAWLRATARSMAVQDVAMEPLPSSLALPCSTRMTRQPRSRAAASAGPRGLRSSVVSAASEEGRQAQHPTSPSSPSSPSPLLLRAPTANATLSAGRPSDDAASERARFQHCRRVWIGQSLTSTTEAAVAEEEEAEGREEPGATETLRRDESSLSSASSPPPPTSSATRTPPQRRRWTILADPSASPEGSADAAWMATARIGEGEGEVEVEGVGCIDGGIARERATPFPSFLSSFYARRELETLRRAL